MNYTTMHGSTNIKFVYIIHILYQIDSKFLALEMKALQDQKT